jgi:hypothetical protein
VRRRPVSRDEVRIVGDHVRTMPTDSVRQVKVDDKYSRLEPIERLWNPLIGELTKELADWLASPDGQEWQASRREAKAKNPGQWVMSGLSLTPEPPRIPWPRSRPRTCRHCARRFYSVLKLYSVQHYCSDTCIRQANAPARAMTVAAMVNKRSEARAKARAGRTCAACGEPIDAQRATKRYCSTRCRMRGHRRSRPAAEA